MVAPLINFYGKIWVGFCLKDTHREKAPAKKTRKKNSQKNSQKKLQRLQKV